ncbi:hypothetical protein PFLG_01606 [Plasmodium falciparum RAJ116]|uniref:Uncharacterized protein n=1 Tax=Plasmodium falciparum RAJ116 TaxID=580058 RepID=A0A0L0CY23_PLAFA|nr:hypothetical protein PFLG_01606 [Plasmodium falciparum RAJ116]
MKKEVDFNLCYEEEKKNLIGLLIENNFDEVFEPLASESLRFFLPMNGLCLIDYQEFQRSKKRFNDLDIEIIKMKKENLLKIFTSKFLLIGAIKKKKNLFMLPKDYLRSKI